MDLLLPLILAAVVTVALIPLLERRAAALHVLDQPGVAQGARSADAARRRHRDGGRRGCCRCCSGCRSTGRPVAICWSRALVDPAVRRLGRPQQPAAAASSSSARSSASRIVVFAGGRD